MKLTVEQYKDCTKQHLAIVLMADSNVIKTVTELSQTYIENNFRGHGKNSKLPLKWQHF